MRTSEHYELNLVEGTDKVNPLVQDVPNYERIDDAMYDNKCSSIGIATELRTGTVHALTRQNEDAPMFRFTASSNYTSGDTFTVDGVQVSALLVDGTPLPNMAYIIGSEVLCVLKGTLMTVFANRTTASDSDKLGGELPSHYATDSDLDALEGVVEAHTDQINTLNNNLTYKPITGLPSTAQSSITVPLPANFKEMILLVEVGGNSTWTLTNTIYGCTVPTSGSYTLREGQSFYYGAGQTRYDVHAEFDVSANGVTVEGSLSANNVINASTILVSGWYR